MVTGYMWYSEEGSMILDEKNFHGSRQSYLWVLLGCKTYMRDRRIYKILWKEREKLETVSMENKGK